MRELISAAWLVIWVAWRTGPLALVFAFGEVISTVLTFLQPLMVGLVVDGLVAKSLERVTLGTVFLIASLAFGGALEALAVGHRVRLIEDVGFAFDREVMHSLAQIGELDRLEEPSLAAAISKVRDRADAMGFCFNGIMSVLIQAAAPVTSICVAMAIDPRLLILTLAGLPAILITRRAAKLHEEADKVAQSHASLAVAWAQLLSNGNAGAERKTFRLWNWYGSRISASVGRRDAAFFRPARFDATGSFVAELFYLACAGATLLWILLAADRPSAGLAAAALLVALDLKGTLATLRFAVSSFGPTLRAAIALKEVRDVAASARHQRGVEDAAQLDYESMTPTHCRLIGVSYVHPSAQSPALREIDLEIGPGQVVAVVGVNGAGKSTLVELLLGLRRPTTGKATLPAARRSVIAQHFGRYEFALAEAVALADFADIARVRACLERASPRRFWEEHDDDIGLQLGTGWPKGTDLSGGQWQAIAAARSFYVHDAGLVVLDEPTAAFDPEAQDAMTERYASVARRVAARGGIALLVTHRMAMPKLADRIIVLDEGRIVESGTHLELISLNGRYAHAYHAATYGFRGMSRGSASNGAASSGKDATTTRSSEREEC